MTDQGKELSNITPEATAPDTEKAVAGSQSPAVDMSEQYRRLFISMYQEKPPGGEKSSVKYQEFLSQLEALREKEESLVIDTEEKKAKVEMWKSEIDKILKSDTKKSTETKEIAKKDARESAIESEIMDASNDPDLIRRLERDVEMIGVIEQLTKLDIADDDSPEVIREKLDKKKMVTSIVERRRWGNVFNKLHAGDKVVTVLVPGADFLKIKNLNDKILGYSRTTKILEKRKALIEEQLSKIGGQNTEILKTDYQSSTIKISEGASEDYMTVLAEVLKEIDNEMTGFISDMIKEELNDKVAKPERTDTLNEFLEELSGKPADGKVGRAGYRMTFGIADVEGSTTEEKLNALNRSTQAARTARGLKEKDGTDSYGAEYGHEIINNELGLIRELREKLKNESITNSDGVTFKLFDRKVLQGKEFLVMNVDVLRDVRKDKFKADAKSEGTLHDVVQYVKKINIIDSVKPFIKSEAVGGDLDRERREAVDLSANFLNLPDVVLDSDDNSAEKEGEKRLEIRREIARIVKTEEKDGNYSSADQFHAQATKIKKCAYLSIDVMDLGVDQLQEFDQLLQEAEIESGGDEDKRRQLLDEKALGAGDKATEKMRAVRARIKEVLGAHGLLMNVDDNKFGAEGVVLGKVGGDEIDLAIDMAELESKGLTIENLMFEIKEATNHGMADVRIIKTVAAEAIRDSSNAKGQTSVDIIKDHLATIKRAERGADIAKNIEENARKINLIIAESKRRGGSGDVSRAIAETGLEKIFKYDGESVKSFVIVVEKNGGFDVLTQNDVDKSRIDIPVDAYDLEGMIDELKSKLAT